MRSRNTEFYVRKEGKEALSNSSTVGLESWGKEATRTEMEWRLFWFSAWRKQAGFSWDIWKIIVLNTWTTKQKKKWDKYQLQKKQEVSRKENNVTQ